MAAPDFVYTSYIRSTPEQVWDALTQPAATTRYWGVELHSDWRVGSEVTWVFAGVTMAHPEQLVFESERPRRLAFSWHTITPEFGAATGASAEEVAALAAEGRSRVAIDIEPIGEAMKLTVTQSGFPDASVIREGISGGWPMIVASLKSLLETGEPLSFE